MPYPADAIQRIPCILTFLHSSNNMFKQMYLTFFLSTNHKLFPWRIYKQTYSDMDDLYELYIIYFLEGNIFSIS